MLASAIALLQQLGAYQAITLAIMISVAVVLYERFTNRS